MKQTTNLKSCCSFLEWMEKESIKTNLEKDLVELFWNYLDKQGKLCEEH